jgi:hypothetical protein
MDSLTKRGEGPVAEFAAMTGTDVATYTRERPGMSAFVLEDGVVYHTYSTYARGLDGLWGMYQWLDRAPKGRNETGIWWRRHDEYVSDVVDRSRCGDACRHPPTSDGGDSVLCFGAFSGRSVGGGTDAFGELSGK